MFEERTYRRLFKGKNLVFFDAVVEETDLMIGASHIMKDRAVQSIKRYRKQIREYILMKPEFAKSLEPIECGEDAPYIIRRMCNAAKLADVGPMAAVAGAISEMVGRDLLVKSNEVIVENGGDIFIKTKIPRKSGIYAGNSPLSEKVALHISPRETPLGICTSSGSVGHSKSFGKADAVVVVSKDTFLADAVATSVCNRVQTVDDIKPALTYASDIKSVDGVVIIIKDKIGACGRIQLVDM